MASNSSDVCELSLEFANEIQLDYILSFVDSLII